MGSLDNFNHESINQESFNDENFIMEALELIDVVEHELVNLEKNPNDTEIINTIFRSVHTIKGSAGMFGLKQLSDFTHFIETLFDELRKENLVISRDIIDITLASTDYIRLLIEEGGESDEYKHTEIDIIDRIQKILPGKKEYVEKNDDTLPESDTQSNSKIPDTAAQVESTKPKIIYRILFTAGKQLFVRGVRPAVIFKELKELGEIHVFSITDHIPLIDSLDPEACYFKWVILLETSSTLNEIKDIFIFVEDFCEISIKMIDEGTNPDTPDYKKIGEILVEQNLIKQEELEQILKEKKLLGNIACEKGMISEETIKSALTEQTLVRKARRERSLQLESKTIRVDNKKLDELVNLVGELVTLQARLEGYVSNNKSVELESISERFERLSTELRDNTMTLRMVPMTGMFNSFHRLVRDLSCELNKEVELIINGSETELDKNVISALKDPLMHIIRNSLDHGIESTEDRIKAGKSEVARIEITAQYLGANVLITISDDGKGFDLEKIMNKAIDKGLIPQGSQLTDKEIATLVCHPGFSTAEKTTDVSGRGVGMDVVKKNIEKLRGYLEIETEKGTGSVIKLKIPLTLAIIDGLLVDIGGSFYIINLSAVDECIDITNDVKSKQNNRDIVTLRGEMIPYIDLRQYLEVPGEPPEIEQLVISKINATPIGFKVDNIIGQHQTVIKSVSKVYRNIREITGATILGDGSIALILDTNLIYEELELNRLHTFTGSHINKESGSTEKPSLQEKSSELTRSNKE